MTAIDLKRRRTQLDDREVGFTLIELLVVVIIIGVLAAIAIPVYIGVQNNAKDTAAKADLSNSKVALQAYVTRNNGGWPTLSTTDGAANATALASYGWASRTVLDDSTPAGSATAYCVKVTSASGTPFYATQADSPTSTKPSGCS